MGEDARAAELMRPFVPCLTFPPPPELPSTTHTALVRHGCPNCRCAPGASRGARLRCGVRTSRLPAQSNGLEVSLNDDREYEAFTLQNGMQVVLVSDPTTDKVRRAARQRGTAD